MKNNKNKNNGSKNKKNHETKQVVVTKYVGGKKVSEGKTDYKTRGVVESNKRKVGQEQKARNKAIKNVKKDPLAAAVVNLMQPDDVRLSGSDFAFDDGIVANGTNNLCPINTPLNIEACKWLAKGLVDEAVKSGWFQSLYAENQDWPSQALVYATNIFISGALSTTPLVSTVPLWCSYLLQMMKGGLSWDGTHKYNHQWYSDVRPGDYSYDTKLPYGPQGSDVFAIYGAPGDEIANTGFVSVNPTTYDPLRGLNAWNSMLEYLKQYGEARNKMHAKENQSISHALVSSSEANKYTTDRSAFSVITSTLGGGSSASGVVTGRAGNEVAIKTPIFSHFTQTVQSAAASSRCPVKTVPTFGDASIGAMLCNKLPEDHVRKLRYGAVKFYDFNEIVNTMNLVLQKAIKLALDDPANKLNIEIDNPSNLPDDLKHYFPNASFEEFCLLLRYHAMAQTSSSQHYFQGIYPNADGNGLFTPFSTGNNSIFVPGAQSVNMPLYPAECMKGIRGRYTVQRDEDTNEIIKINFKPSVLGARYSDQLSGDDYIITTERYGQAISFNLYPASSLRKESVKEKEKDKKGMKGVGSPNVFPPTPPPSEKSDNKTLRVHPPRQTVGFSMFDGQYSGGFGFINDPARISKIAVEWNRLMAALSPYLQQLTVLNSDEGIGGLTGAPRSRILTPVTLGKGKRVKGSTQTYADAYGVVVETSENMEFAAFHEIASFLPIYVSGDKQAESADITNYRVSMRETCAVNAALTSQNVLLSVVHDTIAIGSVKQRDADDGETTKFIQRQAAKGRAGVGDGIVDVLNSGPVQTILKTGGNLLGNLIGGLF